MGAYQETFRRSLTDPDGFWGVAAKLIDWYQKPAAVLYRSNPSFYRWFTGGLLN